MADKESIKFELHLGGINLEIISNKPIDVIHRITELLKEINNCDADDLYLNSPLDIYNMALSEELLANRKISDTISKFAQLSSGYKVRKAAIDNKQVIEMDKGIKRADPDNQSVITGIKKLTFRIPRDKTMYCILHVKGDISTEGYRQISENFKKEMSNIEVKSYFTKEDMASKTLVEGVFFGDFEYDIHEEG